ncbi:FixH family protein [Taklimakanibacter deserti]|uniref:FixH family protein n=1 Tax=Taklimakanibacter deserti TaxID=2267839 RepID=UPI000E6510B4
MSARAAGITGRQVFAVMAAFFVVIIAVNTTLAVFAMRSWTGLVVQNGYVASQGFNEELAEARRQALLGWQESLGYARGRLTLTLGDAERRPVERAKVSVTLKRPSTDREDRQLLLNETASGRYELAVALSPGLWDAEATARTATGETLRRVYRFLAPRGADK